MFKFLKDLLFKENKPKSDVTLTEEVGHVLPEEVLENAVVHESYSMLGGYALGKYLVSQLGVDTFTLYGNDNLPLKQDEQLKFPVVSLLKVVKKYFDDGNFNITTYFGDTEFVSLEVFDKFSVYLNFDSEKDVIKFKKRYKGFTSISFCDKLIFLTGNEKRRLSKYVEYRISLEAKKLEEKQRIEVEQQMQQILKGE